MIRRVAIGFSALTCCWSANLAANETDLSANDPAADVAASAVELLGTRIEPASSARLAWGADQLFDGLSEATPVLVVNGIYQGPRVCLTGAVHGDELNGIEMVRRVMHNLDSSQLRGSVVGVPIVNLQGFRRGSRYLPDRRDLNRHFPGHPRGSSASRIAHSFFQEVVRHCQALVDLHTGSFHRTNMPQLRADLRNPRIAELIRGFSDTVVLHSVPAEGTLRRAAADAGIPAVTLEAGAPLRLEPHEVDHGVRALISLLASLNMLPSSGSSRAEAIYYDSTWVRVDEGGILFSEVHLGEHVAAGEVLATVSDPISNRRSSIIATASGRVLGMALNQVVMPGFAAFRIGITSEAGQEAGDLTQILTEQPQADLHGISFAIRDEAYTLDAQAQRFPAPADEIE